MNTNQFIQTARTVSFLIQKDKDSIPGYSIWYPNAVLTPWGSDEVMKWAKDSRNFIEKEGDLEINSSLNVTLLISYLSESDISIECGEAELLNANAMKLVRFARQKLPPGIADEAAVKIDRRWVSAKLPNFELLNALSYVYARNFDCCESLAAQFGENLDNKIPHPSKFSSLTEQARQIGYLKLNDLKMYRLNSETSNLNRSFQPPAAICEAIDAIHASGNPPRNLDELFDYYVKMAKLTFSHFGNHAQMLFLFDKNLKPVAMMGPHFSDQTDKFIFFRSLFDQIVTLKIFALVWISEAWVRKVESHDITSIKQQPIVGERLSVLAFDRICHRRQVSWNLVRDPLTKKTTLNALPDGEAGFSGGTQYFFVPAMRAMGLAESYIFSPFDE